MLDIYFNVFFETNERHWTVNALSMPDVINIFSDLWFVLSSNAFVFDIKTL